MAAIISWQFMGLPASPSTRAAASRALAFLALVFSALAFSAFGAFLAFVGLGLRDAARCCVSVLAAAGMPLASGGGWSLPSLFLVVFLLAAMSCLPNVVKLRIARCDAIQGEDRYLTATDPSRQFQENDGSFFRVAVGGAGGLRARKISDSRQESP